MGFFVGSPQEEALARLHYLVEEGKSLGLLLGESGSGKTWLLARFFSECRRAGREPALLDLAGRDGREFLYQLAEALQARVTAQDARFQLWRAIRDRLCENRLQHLSTVLLLDHLDEATEEVRALLVRLLHEGDLPGSGTTLVVASSDAGWTNADPRLRERVELRVDLDPWSVEDLEAYTRGSLSPSAGEANAHPWNREALLSVWRATGGLPRRVRPLLELASLVVRNEPTLPLTAETIAALRRELSPVA